MRTFIVAQDTVYSLASGPLYIPVWYDDGECMCKGAESGILCVFNVCFDDPGMKNNINILFFCKTVFPIL